MKKSTICLVLALSMTVCHAEDSQREVINRLQALEAEVAKLPRSTPVRWATADRSRISMAYYTRAKERMESLTKAANLTPEQTAQLAEYETLNRELQNRRMRLPLMPPAQLRPDPPALPPLPPLNLSSPAPQPPTPKIPAKVPPEPTRPARSLSPFGQPATPEEQAELDALANRVAAAKAPVADIVDRRAKVQAEGFNSKQVDDLVAEYAKDRFDLVIDKNDKVLYRTPAEAPDITEGILNLFYGREKK